MNESAPDNSYESVLFPEIARAVQSPAAPGVLPSQDIQDLMRTGRITAAEPIEEAQIQPASLDLRLGGTAYRLQASFLPGKGSTVARKLEELTMAEIDLSRPTVLERGCVYLVPLMEELYLPDQIAAKANPKSTTGRLDVFTRLITDYGSAFERVRGGYSGPLYAEVVPRTFSVVVHPGTCLSQIRFIRGRVPSSDSQLRQVDRQHSLIYDQANLPAKPDIEEGLKLSASLTVDDPAHVIAYRGRKNAPVIDVAQRDHYDPGRFWDQIPSRPNGRLILNPGDFYILASRERVRVPPDFAAEMVAFDPSVGEFRSHYAGFFDPGFGWGDTHRLGTRAVLEVRAHEVPFVIDDGQIVGRLEFSRVAALPDKVYGVSIGSSYQHQELALSKQFRRVRPDPASNGEGRAATTP